MKPNNTKKDSNNPTKSLKPTMTTQVIHKIFKFFNKKKKETSSMKGLFLYLTDKQDDGIKLAKAVMNFH